ncbi:MAG: hypothetical protein Q9220_007805 [cf. Caloplaca sp. 1 TL-2023]
MAASPHQEKPSDELVAPDPIIETSSTQDNPVSAIETSTAKPKSNPLTTNEARANPPNDVDEEALHRTPSGPPHSTFTQRQKYYISFLAAWAAFFSPLSANIYFPALTTLAHDLHKSNGVINLTLTSYMIFQGIAPTIFGDLADMIGRRPVYIAGFVIYIGANVGLALQKNYAALLVLRCLQSTGSSGTVALGYGVVADIATSAERGRYVGYVSFGAMVGPAIAPVLGGILSSTLGWRSIFWCLTILAVIFLAVLVVSFPETGRNVVGNGSVPPQTWNVSFLNYLQNRKHRHVPGEQTTVASELSATKENLAKQRKLRWPNPLKTLRILAEKDMGLLLLYNSLVYTALYAVMASIPYLFAQIYVFNDLQIGLCFLPLGIGCSIASLIIGRFIDYNYRRIAKAHNITISLRRSDSLQNFPIEAARIQVIWAPLYLGLISILAYGWAIDRETHLAIPLVLFFIMGVCLTSAFNIMSTMCVDLYPLSPSTATAANNISRCLMGAAGTAVIVKMIEGMGRGWCFTFIAGFVGATSPMLAVLVKWGPTWREERRVRLGKGKDGEKPG